MILVVCQKKHPLTRLVVNHVILFTILNTSVMITYSNITLLYIVIVTHYFHRGNPVTYATRKASYSGGIPVTYATRKAPYSGGIPVTYATRKAPYSGGIPVTNATRKPLIHRG